MKGDIFPVLSALRGSLEKGIEVRQSLLVFELLLSQMKETLREPE
jgi:hypothetical protein